MGENVTGRIFMPQGPRMVVRKIAIQTEGEIKSLELVIYHLTQSLNLRRFLQTKEFYTVMVTFNCLFI